MHAASEISLEADTKHAASPVAHLADADWAELRAAAAASFDRHQLHARLKDLGIAKLGHRLMILNQLEAPGGRVGINPRTSSTAAAHAMARLNQVTDDELPRVLSDLSEDQLRSIFGHLWNVLDPRGAVAFSSASNGAAGADAGAAAAAEG